MAWRRKDPASSLWTNPKRTRSLKERETAASAGPCEARRVPGHLDEFKIVDTSSRHGGGRDAGRTIRYSRSRDKAERIIKELSGRKRCR